jgi:chromosome segregation ATPase
VRTGHEVAVIEVELHTLPRPTVIRRTITKSTNASAWLLNGRAARQEDVLEAVAALNIQVSNLCQFLPQDKVPEFAKMSPEQLLEATEQAVRGWLLGWDWPTHTFL